MIKTLLYTLHLMFLFGTKRLKGERRLEFRSLVLVDALHHWRYTLPNFLMFCSVYMIHCPSLFTVLLINIYSYPIGFECSYYIAYILYDIRVHMLFFRKHESPKPRARSEAKESTPKKQKLCNCKNSRCLKL